MMLLLCHSLQGPGRYSAIRVEKVVQHPAFKIYW